MSGYKEGYYAVSTIKSQSRRIYPDATDHGVPVHLGDTICKMVQQAIESYGVKGTRQVDRYDSCVIATHAIELMDEWTGGERQMFQFTYVSTPKAEFDGYIYVQEIPVLSTCTVCKGLTASTEGICYECQCRYHSLGLFDMDGRGWV